MKRKLVLIVVFAVAISLIASVVAVAAPQKNMVTGSGVWTNGAQDTFYAEFNAQEATDHQGVKGTLYQVLLYDDGGFYVDVDYVAVYEDHALIGGTTYDAWGRYADKNGHYRYTTVWDGGSGMEETGADYLKGAWDTTYPGSPGVNLWTGGNVQLHFVAE